LIIFNELEPTQLSHLFYNLLTILKLKKKCIVVSSSSLHNLHNIFPNPTLILARFTFVGILSKSTLQPMNIAHEIVYKLKSALNTLLFPLSSMFCNTKYVYLTENWSPPSSLRTLLSLLTLLRVWPTTSCISSSSISTSQTCLSLLHGIFQFHVPSLR